MFKLQQKNCWLVDCGLESDAYDVRKLIILQLHQLTAASAGRIFHRCEEPPLSRCAAQRATKGGSCSPNCAQRCPGGDA
ncbi:MAG: hypothetical protein KDI60_14985, partial [Xanthomonadales bacterium]|nr:hypothetical protein [Xanthomonadales bacterium]